jgi:hypothetical protein
MFWFDVRGTATLLKSATCMSGSHFNAWIPTKQCNTHLWASSAVPCMSVGHIVLGQDVVCNPFVCMYLCNVSWPGAMYASG